VNAVLSEVLSGASSVLGSELVGAYLHGSLASGDFDPITSDVDLVVVTSRELPDATVSALAAMHDAIASGGRRWAQRLEASYIPLAALRRHDPARAMHPRIGIGSPLARKPHGSSWTIERYILRERGVTLVGPPPRELIDAVTTAELKGAVAGVLRDFWALQLDDAEFLRTREYQAFGVLTMCRALHTLECGAVASKPTAARWAIQTLDAPWPAIVLRALAWSHEDQPDGLEETRALIRVTLERARSIS